MNLLPLSELLAGTPHQVVMGAGDLPIERLCLDSRRARPGDLFCAIPGTDQNGLEFVPDALARGAVAVISEEAPPRGIEAAWIVVPEARLALASIAATFYRHPARQLVMTGLTGTNGKTTTAHMVGRMLSAAGATVGELGTIEYRLGSRTIPAARTTPDAITLQELLHQMVGAGCSHAVMEVSSHALDQHRTAGIPFRVAAFSNLTRDHLDYHDSMGAYFESKSRLFRALDANATAVVNVDDPWGRQLLGRVPSGVPALTVGIDADDAAITAEAVELSTAGARFQLVSPWGRAPVALPLLGRINLHNALLASGCALAQNIPFEHVIDALNGMSPVRGRLEGVPTKRGYGVYVDYAHTDDAITNVLAALREITRGQLIVVIGCGGDRDRDKRPLMAAAAERSADRVILTSDNPRGEQPESIIADMMLGLTRPRDAIVRVDRRQAILTALEQAGDGDTVLVAGKGHEAYQDLGTTTIPFDDVSVIRESLDAMV